jgi:hypothetical protein
MAFEQGVSLKEIEAGWQPTLEEFGHTRKQYLMY